MGYQTSTQDPEHFRRQSKHLAHTQAPLCKKLQFSFGQDFLSVYFKAAHSTFFDPSEHRYIPCSGKRRGSEQDHCIKNCGSTWHPQLVQLNHNASPDRTASVTSTEGKKNLSYVRTEWLEEGIHSTRKTRAVQASAQAPVRLRRRDKRELRAAGAGRGCTMSATIAGKCKGHTVTSVRL
jgi:hypothetical protein